MYVQDQQQQLDDASELDVCAEFHRVVTTRVVPRLTPHDAMVVEAVADDFVDLQLTRQKRTLKYMRRVIKNPNLMLNDYLRVRRKVRAERGNTRLERCDVRRRVSLSRPRERRPGSARRTSRSAARQSAGDSSPPGEPPRPAPRPARYSFACLTRDQRGAGS